MHSSVCINNVFFILAVCMEAHNGQIEGNIKFWGTESAELLGCC